jgi:hypothetical protein
MSKPTFLIERLFAHKVKATNFPKRVKIERNAYGITYYQWDAPCSRIESLWISLLPNEIVLSCAITHNHIQMQRKLNQRKITNLQAKRLVVRDAIRYARAFLNNKIAVSITYNADGTEHSFGSCQRDQLVSSIEYTKQVFGPDVTKRAWIWDGEIDVRA